MNFSKPTQSKKRARYRSVWVALVSLSILSACGSSESDEALESTETAETELPLFAASYDGAGVALAEDGVSYVADLVRSDEELMVMHGGERVTLNPAMATSLLELKLGDTVTVAAQKGDVLRHLALAEITAIDEGTYAGMSSETEYGCTHGSTAWYCYWSCCGVGRGFKKKYVCIYGSMIPTSTQYCTSSCDCVGG